ncbi:nucleoid-associated protein [Aestuariivirga sp.]|uniref:nucleoid-associated protein n=1 Tax=Aestuariivirga sp. TaxID=2650926 RepID=UPI0039E25161
MSGTTTFGTAGPLAYLPALGEHAGLGRGRIATDWEDFYSLVPPKEAARKLLSGSHEKRGANMKFENLTIQQVIVHEVLQRDATKQKLPPKLSQSVENLGQQEKEEICDRIVSALTTASQCLELSIEKTDSASFFGRAKAIVDSPTLFVHASTDLADLLADAQKYQNIVGGMVLVISGTVGPQNFPYIIVVKAERQTGFHRGKKSMLELLNDIYLTKSSRFYKVAMMIKTKDPDDVQSWQAFAFDNNLSATQRDKAAVYFYESFMGCSIPKDGAQETQKFFRVTKEYIKSADVDAAKRRNLMDALFSFVRDEQAPQFSVRDFATRYIPPEIADDYTRHAVRKGVSQNAIVRDTSRMKSELKRRRFRIGHDIEFSAAPDVFAESVTIDRVKATNRHTDRIEEATQILVFGGPMDET